MILLDGLKLKRKNDGFSKNGGILKSWNECWVQKKHQSYSLNLLGFGFTRDMIETMVLPVAA